MKKQFRNLLLGLLISVVIIAILFYFFLFLNPLSIHNSNTLKWIPILITALSIYPSASLNQHTSLKFLPILLLPLFLFKVFNYTYFPYVLILLLLGVAMIVITRKNILTAYRRITWITAIGIFLYFFFAQALIIEKEGFGYDEKGQFENALVLWDFSNQKEEDLPEHELTDLNGAPFNLKKLQGKTYFITFWATWCAPCLKEQPELEKLKKEYQHQPDVEFVDISFDENTEKWLKHIQNSNPLGRQLISNNQQQTSRLLGFQGIPMHLIVAPDGTYQKFEPFQIAKSILENSLTPAFEKSKLTKLNKVLDMAESKKHMASVSIFKNDNEIYSRAMGFSNLAVGIKADKNTKYRIGSISKTFTATMIMQLIEEGKLNFEDKLDTFFPKIPNATNISLGHLLRHRSGLFDLTKQEDFENWMEKPQSRQQILNRIIKNGTVFMENERREYSNTNYILLSYIIEEIENKSYAEVLQSRIIEPANLTNTYYGGKINTQKGEAHSYVMSDEWQLASETHSSIPLGAGGIVSTPNDLNKFLHNLFAGEIVSQTSLMNMTKIIDGGGIGLSQFPFPNKKAFGHPGSIDGFNSIAVYFPDEKLTVSYIANGEIMPMREIVFQLLRIYFGKGEIAGK
jgi:D-alanyl-D-alanine carboxypeptidase